MNPIIANYHRQRMDAINTRHDGMNLLYHIYNMVFLYYVLQAAIHFQVFRPRFGLRITPVFIRWLFRRLPSRYMIEWPSPLFTPWDFALCEMLKEDVFRQCVPFFFYHGKTCAFVEKKFARSNLTHVGKTKITRENVLGRLIAYCIVTARVVFFRIVFTSKSYICKMPKPVNERCAYE